MTVIDYAHEAEVASDYQNLANVVRTFAKPTHIQPRGAYSASDATQFCAPQFAEPGLIGSQEHNGIRSHNRQIFTAAFR